MKLAQISATSKGSSGKLRSDLQVQTRGVREGGRIKGQCQIPDGKDVTFRYWWERSDFFVIDTSWLMGPQTDGKPMGKDRGEKSKLLRQLSPEHH